ncbi:MAG TPA: GAF domain-containing SpoIIE family protein phosphatase [Terriglobales bacterium]|nr:GAF domain-containing SpoIIE family protein phosphatase [Terriglobales bacterium]
MAISPQPTPGGSEFVSRARVLDELTRIQQAAHRITSTLDLDLLIDQVVNEVARTFGCNETSVFLRDFDANEMVLAGVQGCTMHGKGARLKIGKQGMVGWVAATGETRYAPDVRKDPFYIECEPGTLCELDIPLTVRGQVIGVFSATWRELDAFPLEQRQLLEVLAGYIAIAIENARLFQQERLEHRRILDDAEEARQIQQALFPQSSPFIPGFTIQGLCAPAGAVSGDWYDFIQLSDGRWGLVLADVSGKGMAAALLMSATRRLVRSLAETIPQQRRPVRSADRRPSRKDRSWRQMALSLPDESAGFNQLPLPHLPSGSEPGEAAASPGELLARVNWSIMDELPEGKYVTMIYGVLDPIRRTLTFANAGHPWPLLVDSAGARPIPTRDGIPLGLSPGRYSEETVPLAPGARLLFYSDGITEATDGREDYGTDRMVTHLSRPDTCAETLLEEVRAFCRGTFADDATVILVRS